MIAWRPACLAALALLWLAVPATAQQIWLAAPRPMGRQQGMVDWEQMFQPTKAWEEVASRIQVYQFHVGLLDNLSDADLAAHFADLRNRHIATSTTISAVPGRPGICGGFEGYANPQRDARVIGRIKRLGFRLDYVLMDGPLLAGHFDTRPQGCRFSVAELIPRVASVTRAYIEAFPGIVLGEVEPTPTVQAHPSWRDDFLALRNGIAAAGGGRIGFLYCDMSWSRPGWDDAMLAMHQLARAEGMKFGVIYNGNGESTSDAEWVTSDIAHFTEVESRLGIIPDQLLVVSWSGHPTHILPITSPTSLTHPILAYLLPRTRITLSRTATGVAGRLADEHGRPVAGAAVAVQAMGADPTQRLPVLRASGTVPANARTALVLLRVNADCNCAGQEDAVIGEASYHESGGGADVDIDFAAAVKPRPDGVAVRPELRLGVPVAHILAAPTQSLSFNSTPIPVTPGAAFTFTVPAASLAGHDMNGNVGILFFGAAGRAIEKHHLRVLEPRAEATGAVTDADGRFVLPRAEAAGRLRLTFAGRPDLRGAVAELR
jgi:hypothetical protein